MRIRKGLSEGWAWPSPQVMDMHRSRVGRTWGGVGRAGGTGSLSFSTLFCLHDHVIQLVTSVKMLGCCSIHPSDCFCGNILCTTC